MKMKARALSFIARNNVLCHGKINMNKVSESTGFSSIFAELAINISKLPSRWITVKLWMLSFPFLWFWPAQEIDFWFFQRADGGGVLQPSAFRNLTKKLVNSGKIILGIERMFTRIFLGKFESSHSVYPLSTRNCSPFYWENCSFYIWLQHQRSFDDLFFSRGKRLIFFDNFKY